MIPFPQRPVLTHAESHLPRPEDLPGGVAYEPKFDGHRALLFVHRGVCRIQSDHGVDITAAFPEIAHAAVERLPSGVVIDGDIVIWGDGAADFGEFRHRLSGVGRIPRLRPSTVSFIASDVLAGAGMDLRGSPFRVRRHALEILLEDAMPPLHMVPQTRDPVRAQDWMQRYDQARLGIVGVVAKGTASPYQQDSATWQEIRIQESTLLVVWGVMGALALPTRLVLAGPDGRGGLEPAGWSALVSGRDGHLLARSLVTATRAHPWPDHRTSADLAQWAGPDEPIHLVDPLLVVEVTPPVDVDQVFYRQRPDLQVADLGRSPDPLSDFLPVGG